MTGLAAIDIVFIILSLILVVRSALRGFIGEFSGLASFVLGILAALFFYKNGGMYVRERFMQGVKVIPEIVAFLSIFLIVFASVKIVAFLLDDIVERVRLRGVDRFLGVILGMAEALVLILLVLFVCSVQPLFDEKALLEKSFFAERLFPLVSGASGRLLREGP